MSIASRKPAWKAGVASQFAQLIQFDVLGYALERRSVSSANSSLSRIDNASRYSPHYWRQLRLVEELFAQIECVTQINAVTTLTTDVILAAQESLVIGAL